LKEDSNERSALGLLVGSAFSLWRAAFLSNTHRDWDSIREHAQLFLQTVVRDNAITFQDDRRTQSFMVGYYLHNARYRIFRIVRWLPECTELTQLKRIVDKLDLDSEFEKQATRFWDELFEATNLAFHILRQSGERD
jgi:hypothetical protein